MFYSYISLEIGFVSNQQWNIPGAGHSARLIKLREIRTTDTKMNTLFKKSIVDIIDNSNIIKDQQLFWLLNGSSIWCYKLIDYINNLMNFAHIKWHFQYLICKLKQWNVMNVCYFYCKIRKLINDLTKN